MSVTITKKVILDLPEYQKEINGNLFFFLFFLIGGGILSIFAMLSLNWLPVAVFVISGAIMIAIRLEALQTRRMLLLLSGKKTIIITEVEKQ